MNTNTNYTPGPWQVLNGNVYHASAAPAPFTDAKGVEHPDYLSGLIALPYSTGGDRKTPAGNVAANARLIAAAPELLEALQLALKSANFANCPGVEEQIEAAIAKATA